MNGSDKVTSKERRYLSMPRFHTKPYRQALVEQEHDAIDVVHGARDRLRQDRELVPRGLQRDVVARRR